MLHTLLKLLLKLQSLLSLPVWAVGAFLPLKKSGADGFIFGQNELKGTRLFTAPAEKTACEVAAVFNASARLFDCGCSYSQTKYLFLKCGALTLWPFGFFGGNPYSLGRVARRLGMSAKRVKTEETAADGCYIFSFFNGRSPSLHTVFAERRGGTMAVYNLYAGDRAPRRFEAERYKGEMIAAYRVGNLYG